MTPVLEVKTSTLLEFVAQPQTHTSTYTRIHMNIYTRRKRKVKQKDRGILHTPWCLFPTSNPDSISETVQAQPLDNAERRVDPYTHSFTIPSRLTPISPVHLLTWYGRNSRQGL